MKVEYAVLSGLSPAEDAELAILMGLCEAVDKASACLGFNAYLNYDKSMRALRLLSLRMPMPGIVNFLFFLVSRYARSA